MPQCIIKHEESLQNIASCCSVGSVVLSATCCLVRVGDKSTRGFPARTATMSAFVALIFSLNCLMGYIMDYRQMDPTIRYYNPDKADIYDTYCQVSQCHTREERSEE